MRHARVGAIVLALLAIGAAGEQPRHRAGTQFDARVVSIADGDTLELVPAGETAALRIRLEGVDAPEFGEPFSREATALARTLLFRQQVRVDGRDVDRYGRLVARVSAGGRDASLELLKAGLACHFTQFAVDPALAHAQSQARTAGLGFWAPTAQKPRCAGFANPGASRAPTQGASPQRAPTQSAPTRPAPAKAAPYRGNVSSRLYHAATCPNANCRNCTRVFASETDAQAAGFNPAGDCLRR